MATAHLVNVEEYLHSVFEPDAEYVEGRIVRRAVPQKPHSKMQGYLNPSALAGSYPAMLAKSDPGQLKSSP